MKKLLLWCALIALALTSCGKKSESEIATPTPTPAPAPVVFHTPPYDPIAPAGVFFLVSRVSVESDSGVFHYPPGCKLYKLSGRYITDDGRQLTLRADQVTNDLRIAERVAGRDPKLQAAIQATIRLARTPSTPSPLAAPQVSSRPNLDGDTRKEDRSRKNRN